VSSSWHFSLEDFCKRAVTEASNETRRFLHDVGNILGERRPQGGQPRVVHRNGDAVDGGPGPRGVDGVRQRGAALIGQFVDPDRTRSSSVAG
jgi:hypothetical protein